MILSHTHKFIFLKTIKVGGTSLEIALSKFCGENDILTKIRPNDEQMRSNFGFRGAQNYRRPFVSIPGFGDIYLRGRRKTNFYGHMPATRVRSLVEPDIWDSYFKFSVIRNPYDVIISLYYWNVHIGLTNLEFQDWVVRNCKSQIINASIFYSKGRTLVDFLVRYEHLEEDLTYVTEKLQLSENIFPVMNGISSKTGIRLENSKPERMFANFELGKKLVEEKFALEFKIGGYEKI